MRKALTALSMCFGTFTVIPAGRAYDPALRRASVSLLPVAGAAIAALWYGALRLVTWLELPAPLPAAIAAALPFALSGFMHFDGFMDVSDAVLSRRPPADRRRILKDSHIGAFAAISLGLLLLFSFAANSALMNAGLAASFTAVPVVTRICSAAAVGAIKPMPGSQYEPLGFRPRRLWAWLPALAAVLAGAYLLLGPAALTGAALAAFAYWCSALSAAKNLGGFNGDCAGFALTLGELFGVIGVVIMGA